MTRRQRAVRAPLLTRRCRLDPDRALSQRLRDQLAAWSSLRFHLLVANASSIRLLRQLEARVELPMVARPRADREFAPERVDAENALADIEAVVVEAVQEGAHTLVDVTSPSCRRCRTPHTMQPQAASLMRSPVWRQCTRSASAHGRWCERGSKSRTGR